MAEQWGGKCSCGRTRCPICEEKLARRKCLEMTIPPPSVSLWGGTLEDAVKGYVRSNGFVPTGQVSFEVKETEGRGDVVVAKVMIERTKEGGA